MYAIRSYYEFREIYQQLLACQVMPIAALAAHGRQDGIGNFFIFFAFRAQRPYFFSIQRHQLTEACLVPGKENEKSQNKHQ